MEHTKASLCAKAMRTELKKEFPNIKFSVTSENFSGGNAVNVHYVDGVSKEKVEAITRKYQYGHFNGMIDSYEYSNTREDIPQVKWVSVVREFSKETSLKLMLELSKKYGIEPREDLGKSFTFDGDWFNYSQLIWREYINQDIN